MSEWGGLKLKCSDAWDIIRVGPDLSNPLFLLKFE